MEKRFQVHIDTADVIFDCDSSEKLWVEVVLNPEGIIVDVYRNDDDDMADCIATGCHTWNEMGLISPEGDDEPLLIDCKGCFKVHAVSDGCNVEYAYDIMVEKLVKAAKVADEFFQQNDDFTEGEFPVPGFIQDLRNSLAEVTK